MTYYEDFLEIKGISAETPGIDIQADDFDGLPDHIEQVMDGVIDTMVPVAGTEGLTAAQEYLHGALFAQGVVPQMRDGNEGAMDTIKKTFGKALEYIQKIFRGIWDFFFKKKTAETAVKETKASLLECKKVVNTVEFKEKIKVINIEDDVKARGNKIIKLAGERKNVLDHALTELEKRKDVEPKLYNELEGYAKKLISAGGDEKTFSSTDFSQTLSTCEYYVEHADQEFKSLRGSESFYKKYYESFEHLKSLGLATDDSQAPEQAKGVTIRQVMEMLKIWITAVAKVTKLNLAIVTECNKLSEFIASKK